MVSQANKTSKDTTNEIEKMTTVSLYTYKLLNSQNQLEIGLYLTNWHNVVRRSADSSSVRGRTTGSWWTYHSSTIAARWTLATTSSVTSGSCWTSLDAATSSTTPAASSRTPTLRSCCECAVCPPSTTTPSCCLAFCSRVLPPSYSGCLPSRPPRSC